MFQYSGKQQDFISSMYNYEIFSQNLAKEAVKVPFLSVYVSGELNYILVYINAFHYVLQYTLTIFERLYNYKIT